MRSGMQILRFYLVGMRALRRVWQRSTHAVEIFSGLKFSEIHCKVDWLFRKNADCCGQISPFALENGCKILRNVVFWLCNCTAHLWNCYQLFASGLNTSINYEPYGFLYKSSKTILPAILFALIKTSNICMTNDDILPPQVKTHYLHI